MKIELSKFYSGMRDAMMREEGQDLAQVGLIVALVAVGATAGMNSVATAVSGAFTSLGALVSHASGVLIR